MVFGLGMSVGLGFETSVYERLDVGKTLGRGRSNTSNRDNVD